MDKSSKAGGIGIAGVLGIIFVVLKLLRYIDWSWLWVLSPFWIPWSIILFVIILVVIIES